MRSNHWKKVLAMLIVMVWGTACGTNVPATLTSSTFISRISVSSDGMQGNDDASDGFSISANGRYIAFDSYAKNLVPGDANGTIDVFVHDMQTGTTTLISVASDGTQGNGHSGGTSISADGRYVAFGSDADNLVYNDTNSKHDVFIHDMQTGATTRVSVASDGRQGNDYSYSPSISADGRFVAFQSDSSTLVIADTNSYGDIFVRDMQTGITTRVSVTSDGTQGNGGSDSPSISADGRFVAFDSYAGNLVSDDTNGENDVFVHDMRTGTTTRVSIVSDGMQGETRSEGASISANGRYIAFMSGIIKRVPGNSPLEGETEIWEPDIFVYDMQTGITALASVVSNGKRPSSGSGHSSISADGRYVAFGSGASNLVDSDTNGKLDVFVHDMQTGTTTLVSLASDGMQGNENSRLPSISADGRYVVFHSYASNLVRGDTNHLPDVFLRVLDTPAPTP